MGGHFSRVMVEYLLHDVLRDVAVDQACPDTPVVIQQVSEVGDVEPDLAALPRAVDALEHVLHQAQQVLAQRKLRLMQHSMHG